MKRIPLLSLSLMLCLALAACGGKTPVSDSAAGTSSNPVGSMQSAAPANPDASSSAQPQEPDTSEGDDDFTPPEIQRSMVANGIYAGPDWTLTFPKEWNDTVSAEVAGDVISFYEPGCQADMGGGWLFSIQTYADDEYQQLPDAKLLTTQNGIRYVAVFPSDVQCEGASEAHMQLYQTLFAQVNQVIDTFTLS